MNPLTIQQIRQAVRGKFLAPQPEEWPQSITSVCTDTRRIEAGCLFIALRLVGVLARMAGNRWLGAPDTVRA